jgi:hypothetical protein
MPHSRFSSEEIERRGNSLYDEQIRQTVETNENIGKIVIIDIETGDYVLDADELAASRRAHEMHPGGAFWTVRVGYNAVHSVSGRFKVVK